MALGVLLAFAGACALLFLKPGPAMSVIVANSVGYGVRGGMVSVAGNVIGFALLLAIVGLGLSWIAVTMQTWFDWIRLGGAIYLFWLGIARLRNAARVSTYSENPTGELFRDGFLVAVANPEVLLFLAAFLPPFVDPRVLPARRFSRWRPLSSLSVPWPVPFWRFWRGRHGTSCRVIG